jgi:tctex1 domain-containing protein 2
MSSAVAGGAQPYQLQPAYRKKASVNAMREEIAATLEQELKGQTYNGDTATQQTKKISDEIKNRLKALGLDRYKYLVQVVIGEQRGEGVRMGCRCFWDSDTDALATETFTNVSSFSNYMCCLELCTVSEFTRWYRVI